VTARTSSGHAAVVVASRLRGITPDAPSGRIPIPACSPTPEALCLLQLCPAHRAGDHHQPPLRGPAQIMLQRLRQMHARPAQAGRERPGGRIAAWRDTPYFPTRAGALALTRRRPGSATAGAVPDQVWAGGRHYDEAGLAGLTIAIAGINAWNRPQAITGTDRRRLGQLTPAIANRLVHHATPTLGGHPAGRAGLGIRGRDRARRPRTDRARHPRRGRLGIPAAERLASARRCHGRLMACRGVVMPSEMNHCGWPPPPSQRPAVRYRAQGRQKRVFTLHVGLEYGPAAQQQR